MKLLYILILLNITIKPADLDQPASKSPIQGNLKHQVSHYINQIWGNLNNIL